jgi:serine/threonine-protein kinase
MAHEFPSTSDRRFEDPAAVWREQKAEVRMIGSVISHYKILEKLGEGGMGVVYKAQDLKLDRLVALKFLPPGLSTSEWDKTRFMREAKTASALDHPNICTIYEVDEAPDGQMFLVMAYYEGKTLKEKIELQRPSLDEALHIALEIAQGLEAAHEKGIVHRDIKSANIMLTLRGQAKVMDFGLAKAAGRTQLTKAGATVGTIAYMSPEQALGENVDHRSDIWSFGVVLYEMISGELPFKSEYEQAVVYSILNEKPKSLREIRSEVPEALEKIISKCIARQTADRYQTAAELLIDLRSLSGKPVPALLRELSHAIELLKRKPVYWITGAGVLLVLVLLFVASPWRAPSTERKSIAVLPFSNLSGNKEDDYFSEGITEDIIAQLWKIGDIKIISRTSVMQYKDTKKNLRDIGRELGVANILEGSVRLAENRIRISGRLVDVSSEAQLWGDTYERDMKDVFEIQSDVAQKIAGALKANFFSTQKGRIGKKPTENIEAYNLYLKGRFFWNQRTAPALKKGIDFFQQAVSLDSTFALAFSGIADCYSALGSLSFLSPDDAFLKAKAAASRALELDSTLAEPHASLAYSKFYYDWDWGAAEQQFKIALALNPTYVVAYDWYSVYLTAMDRTEEARSIIKKAQDLDPLSLLINTDMGFTLYYHGHYDQAIKELLTTIELDPKYAPAHLWLGRTYQEKKMYAEAIQEYQKTTSAIVDWPVAIAAIGHVYGMAGKKAEAQKTLAYLNALSTKKFVTAYGVALVYASLGEKEKAFLWLNKALEERSNWLVWLKLDPRWVSIRTDKRFADLVRKVGLP